MHKPPTDREQDLEAANDTFQMVEGRELLNHYRSIRPVEMRSSIMELVCKLAKTNRSGNFKSMRKSSGRPG